MKELEKIYKALGNRRRLAIIKFLENQREASVSEITKYLKLSFRSTSKHLAVLRQLDIVDKEQRSLLVIYSLSQPTHPIVKQFLTLV
jgi:DNA-binding transcriptional ArsR family regulator